MSEINFEENNFNNYQNYSLPEERGMIGWLLKKNIIKDKKTAEIFLILISIVFLSLAFYIQKNRNNNNFVAPNPNQPEMTTFYEETF
jgi:hypothetical protein